MQTDVMPTDETKRMVCPDQETLANYLGGWVDDNQSGSIELHLENCNACQATLARIESEPDSLLDSVKSITSDRETDKAVEPEVKYAMSIVKRLPASDDAIPTNDPANHFVGGDFPGDLAQRMIGPYQLLRSLGHGGMGSVYLARHCQLDKLVAIKVLPSRWLSSEVHLSRFQREIRAAGGLNHPSIVTATDAGQQDEIYYLVMEYVDGYDLSRVARLCGPLGIADACEAIRRVALGLSHAHSLGIVHRDIKPSNLMLSQTGEVKILDFGLARHSLWDEASAELTTVGQLMGTLDYMAPEQAECAAAVDYRADLYSLGATLFRLLVGRPPLAAAPDLSPLSKLKLLASHDSPRVDTLRDDVPKELANFIALLLHRDPSRRPASAAHVAEKLESFAVGNDLVTLALQAKQKHKTNPQNETHDGLPRTAKMSAARSNGGGIGRWGWLVASAGFAALLFAGISLVIETQKGQLVIESDAENISVRLLSAGKQYDTVKVQSGATATKLFAGKYEIEIEGASDELLIDRESVIIRKGETVLAKIGRPQTSPVPLQEVIPLVDEPVYDGEPLSVWLNRAATERSPDQLYSALQAVKKLVGPTNGEQVRNSLMNTMATVSDQKIGSGVRSTSFDTEVLSTIKASFPDYTHFYEFLVETLRNSDAKLRERIYPLLIRFDQTKSTPLINYLLTDVFPTETDPKIVRLAAGYVRNYLLMNRDFKNELNQELAAKFYANDTLPLDFWMEFLPPENFFGYAEFMQQKAIEALESESSPDGLLTQAAIILTELENGIGPLQVSLSEQDKKRVAGRVANVLDRLAERPSEIGKLVDLSKAFSTFASPRNHSMPYFLNEISSENTDSQVRANALLALELLDLVESIGLYASTDAAVERILAATLQPALGIALQLNANAPFPPNELSMFAWPDLTVEQQRRSPRELIRLPLDKADLLAYVINVAGYFALSDAAKEKSGEVFISQFAEIQAENILAQRDQDGNGTLSKVESSMTELTFKAYDQDGDESLSQEEIRDFTKAKLMAPATQDRSNAAKSFDSKTLEYANRIVNQNDANKDGVLDVSEWTNISVDPSAADMKRDGKITVEEYALWLLRNRETR